MVRVGAVLPGDSPRYTVWTFPVSSLSKQLYSLVLWKGRSSWRGPALALPWLVADILCDSVRYYLEGEPLLKAENGREKTSVMDVIPLDFYCLSYSRSQSELQMRFGYYKVTTLAPESSYSRRLFY